MKKRFCAFIVTVFFSACSSCSQETLPDEKTYAENADLLVKTSQKFADETDAKKLHEVAMAVQTTRALACSDYNGECSMFGIFLSRAIELSAKGSLTPDERKQLQDKAAEIRLTVELGKNKLHEETSRRQRK